MASPPKICSNCNEETNPSYANSAGILTECGNVVKFSHLTPAMLN